MAFFLAPIINSQIEDANGNPLSGGTIETYLAGSSTFVTTYSTNTGVPNTYPIVLNTLGLNNQGAVWLVGGSAYKFIIKDSTGVVQRSIDNVSGINDTTFAVDQWVAYASISTFVSATSFTVSGDQTQTFQVGRRIKTTNTGGTVYSTITGSVYSAPNTTVTVRNDSGVLDAGLSQVTYGLISVSDTSLPGGLTNFGQCRLLKSGANLVLSPFNGNRITIAGSICLIPSGGVSLAPTALTPSTLYYIYAFMSGATLTLEASTTGHGTDTTTGIEVKAADPTRTLVGVARPIAGPAWQDATNQRFVLSWFNQRPIYTQTVLTAGAGSNSTGTYAVISANLLLEFLAWSLATVQSTFQGSLTNNVINSISSTCIYLDGAPTESFSATGAYANNASQPVACTLNVNASEGYHTLNIFAQQNLASTATYQGGGSPGARCSHAGIIQG